MVPLAFPGGAAPAGHSPLTGIFLIRRHGQWVYGAEIIGSQSPDGDFFDPANQAEANAEAWRLKSQSPDGDFFDPAGVPSAHAAEQYLRHSPLTGIFLIRRPIASG